jgi:chromosome segregation ATPase
MRPIEFTPEAIIAAGRELQAAGRNVNGFSIRKKIGGGNASRLKQVWDEHSIQTEAKAEPVAELPAEVAEKVAHVTQSLTERISALASEMNATAVQTAERRVSEVLRSAGEQRDQAERELFDAAEAVEDLENLLDAAKTNADELVARLSEMQIASQAQAVELAQVRERLSLAEQNADQARQEHADELARLHESIEAARLRYRAELDEAKKAIKIAEGERDQVHSELATVKARAEAADQSHQEQKKLAAAETHRTAERLTKAQTERDQARAEAGAAREEAARLAGQAETLQAQVKDIMSALAERAP